MRSNINPLEWPIVNHHQFLLNASSFSRALLIHDWPHSPHLRCLRRVWVEQATQGLGNGRWRLCNQTTQVSFNHTYTSRLELINPENELAVHDFHQEVEEEYRIHLGKTPGAPFWNAAEKQGYELFSCWEMKVCYPVPDAPTSYAVYAPAPFSLTVNSKPKELIDFLTAISCYTSELTPAQIISLSSVEVFGRRYNRNVWPEPIPWHLWKVPVG